ncbi:hypothetical protein [Cryobacterium sp. Y62]|uniref:hypothetical protein n=1 Tax=Cryobacterium sp. Y62 TaxID=2048284 RepID=UPI0011B09A24|nr:hypothetical protein [Cryobacterium sp. Y62]
MNRNQVFGAVMALTVSAAVVLGGLLGIAPKIEEVRAVTAYREVVESQNAEYEIALESLQRDFDGIAELRTYLGTLQTAVPPDAAIGSFVGQIEVIARQNNVTLGSLTLGDAVAYEPVVGAAPPIGAGDAVPPEVPLPDADSANTADAAANPFSDGAYLALPITMSVQGAQSNLFDFVAGLQHGERTVSISTLVTEVPQGTGTTELAITGMIYVLLDPSSLALTQ